MLRAPTLGDAVLSGVLDGRMQHDADRPCFVFPSATADPSVVSFLEFGRACLRFTRIIAPQAPVTRGEVIGLLVHCDTLMYTTAVMGIIRGGHAAFPLSPRIPYAAIVHLLKKVGSHRLIATSSSLASLVNQVQEECISSGYHLVVEELPRFDEVYPLLARETAADPFEAMALPQANAYPEGVEMYLHSSGSTGMPKAIAITHDYLYKLQYSSCIAELEDFAKDFVLSTVMLPTFHIMGLYFQLFHPLYTGRTAAIFKPMYPAPATLPTPAAVLKATKESKADGLFAAPAFLEVWVHDPAACEILKSMKIIGFGGGPIASEVGNKLVQQGCRLVSAYGSTETGPITRLYDSARNFDGDNWPWLSLAANVRARWVHQGEGLHELQVLASDTQSLAVENLSDVRGYATQDLFMQHPERKDLWQIVGRVDDVIMMANGEKCVPGPMEGALLAQPGVHGVVMFGRARNYCGILIEPKSHETLRTGDDASLAAFRNEIWPVVQDMNRKVPAFSRVYKEMILVTQPDNPLPRAAKGTVNRKAALFAYETEINAAYMSVDHPEKGGVSAPQEWNESEVLQWLEDLAASVNDDRPVAANIDLFSQGFDSLSATFLRNHIFSALRNAPVPIFQSAAAKIANDFIYVNPTLRQLKAAIFALAKSDTAAGASSAADRIRAMIASYSAHMPKIVAPQVPAPLAERFVVLLTGSTGGLGSHILAELLADEKVARVYTLNRISSSNASSASRHADAFANSGLDETLLSSTKLSFLEGDASTEHLGIGPAQYLELSRSVNVIIHNAWRLDFNLSLGSFEPHVAGTRRLLDLAFASQDPSRTRVLLTSSVAVAQSWPKAKGAFPEEPLDDPTWSVGGGYGESKYVAERLLVAARDHGLQTTSLRIGQISGSKAKGTWATTDWLPILVKSSIALGSLPEAKGLVSWLPFEAVARTVLDIAFAPSTSPPAVNVVHPHPVSWNIVMQSVSDALVAAGVVAQPLSLAPFKSWQEKLVLRDERVTPAGLAELPALKLVGFFAGLARAAETTADAEEAVGVAALQTSKAQSLSTTLASEASLDRTAVGKWIEYWQAKGYFA